MGRDENDDRFINGIFGKSFIITILEKGDYLKIVSTSMSVSQFYQFNVLEYIQEQGLDDPEVYGKMKCLENDIEKFSNKQREVNEKLWNLIYN